MSPAQWHLIQTKPACEALAQSHLQRQAYEVYWPRLAERARVRGRWADRVVSLFPRYLFLRLRVGLQALAPVRSTVGIANVVRFGREYTTVPESVIDDLRRREDPETGLHRLHESLTLQPGDRVRVLSGSFEGLEGIFQRMAGHERVIVLLRLLGCDAPVRIPLARIETSLQSRLA